MQDVIDIEVRPLSPNCGAEIRGVDLSQELSKPVVDRIKQAWLDHLVIVFRNQKIDQEQQLRFAAHFGELGVADAAVGEVDENLSRLEGRYRQLQDL